MATAASSASPADVNTAITPSPRALTTTPSTSTTAASIWASKPANHTSARVSPMRPRTSVDDTMSQNTTARVERIEGMPGEVTSRPKLPVERRGVDVLGIADDVGAATDRQDRVAHAREPLAGSHARLALRRTAVATFAVVPVDL